MNHHTLSAIFIVILYMTPLNCNGQLVYPIEGRFRGKSAQGFAISHDKAFLFYDGGLCRSFDLKRGRVITDFNIGSASKNNHVNSASFGRESIKGNSLPVIYISECRSPYRCFVENITDSTSQTVQTIVVKRTDADSIVHNWVVDSKQNCIYSIRFGEIVNKQTGMRRCRIIRYKLPKLNKGELVVFTESDVKDTFEVFFPNLLQGASIYKNNLYMPVGLHEEAGNKRKDGERALIVVNLKKKKIEKKIDLTNVTASEPEDMDFYQGGALLYTGQDGGIYKVKLK